MRRKSRRKTHNEGGKKREVNEVEVNYCSTQKGKYKV